MHDPNLVIDSSMVRDEQIVHLNYWNTGYLRGNVKSIKTSHFQTCVLDGNIEFSILLHSFLIYYNHSGHIEYALSLDQDNDVLWEYHYTWDLHKKLLRCKCLNPDKKIAEFYSYHFNDADEMVYRRCYMPNGKLLWEKLTDGITQKNDLLYRVEHVFNELGEELERHETSRGGATLSQSFQYKHDHHQNWIKKIEYTKPLHNITAITKRLIEYYDE
ncbi:hypothetical protein LJC68_08375 [Bacteroidales bacterium OttesenSCG-928-B11]|nr:hypothetical protein [Bacteroidales bacterium OttesenSCG-928-E04]MDL2308246.1 hypothetical protein [Bacteroidales bacterium OttesenSCG-928-C03]MDL2312876.1 hypothetical protein [Bacteroidales bacterium OttesenSCG-928-B11]MDL2326218.1 hypothetical protein [Bacteroidales bacterium OttesenSCG-928-A14]